MNSEKETVLGGIYATLAFVFWGLFPLFWKQLEEISSLEVLGHRIFWSFLFLFVFLILRNKKSEIYRTFKDKKSLFKLMFSTLIIGTNWYLYIWAVNNGYIIETSLGYFINPLVNVLFGRIFLKEKLRPFQWLAVLLAFSGILYMTLNYGQFPWIALTLAFSFGFYGLIRKITNVNGSIGLFVETTLILPLALLYLVYLKLNNAFSFGINWHPTLFLMLSGVATSLPLIWFANSARRLKLSTLGFFQYIAPSLQLALAVFVYQEEFTKIHFVTFGLIWIAIAVFISENLLFSRNQSKVPSNLGAQLKPDRV